MNRRSFLEVGAAAIASLGFNDWAVVLGQPGQDAKTILTNASLIDGVQPEPLLKATVVIEGGKITRVSATPPTRSERQGAQVFDLGGAWLLPGLFDVHSHLSSPLQALPGETRMDLYLRMGKEALDAFQLGITGVRVVGAPDYSDVAWRKAFARGLFPGPRLFVAGPGISPTAGHGRYKRNADGPAALRKMVRERIQSDVDFIKIYVSGGVLGAHRETPDQTHFLPDELETIFQTASQRGYKVAAHAGNAEGVKQAVRAGAHTIEHGYLLNEEAIDVMVRQKTILVPTLMVTFATPEAAQSSYETDYVNRWPLPPNLRHRADEHRGAHVQSFKAALEAGVRMASGSDQNPLADASFLEIETLVRCGMTPMQAIVAATRTAAEATGVEKELGTVETGKLADLLVIEASPLDSIHNLRKTAMVFKEGRLVVDKR